MIDLESFFNGRTIGYSSTFGGWHWRGSEYDEGWVSLTEEEIETFYYLIEEFVK